MGSTRTGPSSLLPGLELLYRAGWSLCVCHQSGGRLRKWVNSEPESEVTRGMDARANPGNNFSLQISMVGVKALLCSISLESLTIEGHMCDKKQKNKCSIMSLWTVACQSPLSMGFFQGRILEWVAISSSRASSQPRDQTQVSCTTSRFFTI